jgi:polysaccharide export outer membrane protein
MAYYKYFFVSVFALSIGLSSCKSRKEITYFQGEESVTETISEYLLTYEVNDLLAIEISSPEPEVAAPFNQPEVIRQGNAQSTSYENGVPVTYGYLIQEDSTVSLPIIGRVKVAGLNKAAVIDSIEQRASKYIDSPTATINLLNFKVTILGEVTNPGTFNIPNERITILQAIGIAKDLKITGERKNVLVIRHENGKKQEYRIDLTSKEIFESPVYYLKQNDVVYVEPNRRSRLNASSINATAGLFVSTATLIISTMVVIFNK